MNRSRFSKCSSSCLLFAFFFGCDGSPTDVWDIGQVNFSVVAGGDQSGLAYRELPEPLVVLAELNGKPLKGLLVNFVVTVGGGSVFAGAALTDKDGFALEYWTLGDPGPQEVQVRAVDSETGEKMVFATFKATALDLGIGFGDEQFSLIPAGTFQMGDAVGNGFEWELPVHTVNITQPFYMQRTEVTQAQWQAVMGSNPSQKIDCGETCPVEQVSWNDIETFLATLNAQDPGKNYRLPTEAEWEYAARAGTTGDYGGTGVLDEMGWYVSNSNLITHPAAQKQANAWGLFDMHGNVNEWVQDWHSWGYYEVSPTDDPQGPATGSARVLRGASYGDPPSYARSSARHSEPPTFWDNHNGFRLARTH
jgi:formylglycine-generating enzyme required for sulfatase activity